MWQVYCWRYYTILFLLILHTKKDIEIVGPTSLVIEISEEIWEDVANICEKYNLYHYELFREVIENQYDASDISQYDLVLCKPNLL